ncbi:MAG: putative flavoprotein (TIGR03862 family) [Saprospiraceae bacterium]
MSDIDRRYLKETSTMQRKKIIIIGGGASGLVAADFLSLKYEVHIFEKGKTVGRKFLVAGNGGFNLTNQATGAELLAYYSPTPILHAALQQFGTEDTRKYFADLGIPTFVGSSGRIFPEQGIKPVQVLQSMKKRLIKNGVSFHFKHEFIGFDEEMKPIIRNEEEAFTPLAEKYIFALGGASWSITGSDGTWLDLFSQHGINTVPFQASNCGVNVEWSADFKEKHAGKPLKNIAVKCRDKTVKGEALITKYGLEGNAIYPIIPEVRALLNQGKEAVIHFDFKTQNTESQLLEKVASKNISPKNYAFAFKLSKSQIALIKEFSTKEEYLSCPKFIANIKNLAVPIQSLRPIEEAISTVGGIDISEVNDDFSLNQFPHISVIGEMLDWDAPTGGFLLQGCFSSAVKSANSLG